MVFDRGDYRTVDKERALARAQEIRGKLRG